MLKVFFIKKYFFVAINNVKLNVICLSYFGGMKWHPSQLKKV